MVHTLNISKMCLYIKSHLSFHYSSYLQTSIANVHLVNNRSLLYTYLRTRMYRYVYVTLYVYVMCLIETSLIKRNVLTFNERLPKKKTELTHTKDLYIIIIFI